MALERKDRVKDQTNSTGTGTITIDGVAPTGYRTIAAAHTTGSTIRYTITNSTGSAWEVGEGIWTSSNSTLTRATVFASSNSNSLVNFSAGAKTVFSGPSARDFDQATEFYYQSTAPTTPSVGARWLNSNTGDEYVWVYDGNSGQWVQFAGVGTSAGTGSAPQWSLTSSPTTMVSGGAYAVRTNTTAPTMTLPATPVANDVVYIMDADNSAATNNITVARNGSTIMGLSENLTINVNGASVRLQFINSSWRLV